MPIYEYKCNVCSRKSAVFVRGFSNERSSACKHCGSKDLKRLISLFAVVRSEDSLLDDLADPSSFGDVDENDPKSVARWARKMGKEMGEDVGPEFDEMVERMEAGEMPDDLGGGDEDPL